LGDLKLGYDSCIFYKIIFEDPKLGYYEEYYGLLQCWVGEVKVFFGGKCLLRKTMGVCVWL